MHDGNDPNIRSHHDHEIRKNKLMAQAILAFEVSRLSVPRNFPDKSTSTPDYR
jgi:hypothetical protein